MDTLGSTLAALGYDDAAQQRSFMRLLQATGCLGAAATRRETLTDTQADALLQAVDFGSRREACEWLTSTMKEHWQAEAAHPPSDTSIGHALQARDAKPLLNAIACHVKQQLPLAEPPAPKLATVPVSRLILDPERFQFRRGGGKEGVRERERIQGAWNPLLHGGTLLLYEDAPKASGQPGALYVVDGFHRTEFAKRCEAQGQKGIEFPAHILRAADGITPEDARIIGAYLNMAKEFRDPDAPHNEQQLIDAASAFHSARRHGVKKSLLPVLKIEGELADAKEAGGLSPQAFAFVERGEVPVCVAAELARRETHPARQQEAMRAIHKKLHGEAASWVERVASASENTAEILTR